MNPTKAMKQTVKLLITFALGSHGTVRHFPIVIAPFIIKNL